MGKSRDRHSEIPPMNNFLIGRESQTNTSLRSSRNGHRVLLNVKHSFIIILSNSTANFTARTKMEPTPSDHKRSM